ncbi:MAG: rhodanese-like domain-containing protein [Deltaproteobacteria bacterium]|nr:rhodanese-like domain-containing protein [Deltaproteobacteria bacterium]
MSRLEPMAWFGTLAILTGVVIWEGARRAELEAELPIESKELYGKLAKSSVRLQLIDVRTDGDEFEDAHVPGAIPFPGCDPSATDSKALPRILASAPSVIISEDGDAQVFAKCRAHFTTARNLAGGMAAWSDANYPEDVGEYTPPRAAAGGGCL